MIDLYTWSTPNGRKISIMLEETGLPYRVHAIDLSKGEQFRPEYVAISPYGKIPAIVDDEGPNGAPFKVFESGAILIYLAEKTGKFLPDTAPARYEMLQWLMFQMGNVGPIFGQAHHFLRFAPQPVPYAIERFSAETVRLYEVLQRHLAQHEYLAGQYSVADIATFPWVARFEWHKISLENYPSVRRWFDIVGARPAVRRGMAVPKIS
ncbi:MAG TPA: glutathione S-transferase N-terminal domain-containing protein [Burkholderiales bacterium]|nr:glutathione S-transferase N-terminal domain-containing protein [Burkholderiales bacterium]